MNPRNIIAIVAAVIVVIGVIIWFSSGSDELAMEEQRSEQAEVARASDEEESAARDEAARDAEEADAQVTQDSASEADEAIEDNATTGSDETTGDTGTEQSETMTDSEAGTDGDGQEGAGGSDIEAATARDPAELLTPENFEQEEVLALIDDSDALSDERRSTLRALVERASDDPEMVDEAIESVRDALDLPPLN